MPYHARLFIDFWNFSLNWTQRQGEGVRCDWQKLPLEILGEVGRLYKGQGLADDLELDETLVYASVDVSTEGGRKLKGWLDGFLDRLPSVRVITKEREARPFRLHCRHCGTETGACPNCEATFTRSVEKGVDTHMVTDLLSLAWQGAFDVAVLLTSDADFVPAVHRVQERGLKVIDASWAGHGHQLKKACWASFDLDTIAPHLHR